MLKKTEGNRKKFHHFHHIGIFDPFLPNINLGFDVSKIHLNDTSMDRHYYNLQLAVVEMRSEFR